MKCFFKIRYFFLLLTLLNKSNAQTTDHEKSLIERNTAIKMSDFFTSSLKDAVKETSTEKAYQLFFNRFHSIQKKKKYRPNIYITPINLKSFRIINRDLESSYCNFFPIITREVIDDPNQKNAIVSSGILTDSISLCDTIVTKIKKGSIPIGIDLSTPNINYLKQAFITQIKKDNEDDSYIKKKIIELHENTGEVDLTTLSSLLLKKQKENPNFFRNITDNDKRYLAITFWNYISYCANYDLYQRRYKYDD